MLVRELTEEESWLDVAKSKLSAMGDRVLYGPKEDKLINWVKDHIHRKGTQWIYRNVDKKFPKRYIKTDVDKAIKIVLKGA